MSCNLKKYSLVLFFFISFHCNAQYQKPLLDIQVDSLIAALHEQGMDTICIYQRYCVGCRGSYIREDSPCASKVTLKPTYIFWKSRAKTYAAFRDNCTRAAPVLISKNDFWDYLIKHKDEIKKGEIKAFTVVDKKVDNGEPQSWRRDHGMHYGYVFYMRTDTVSQYIDAFDVQREKKFQKKTSKNVHYNQNTSSAIWKIVKQFEEAVLEIEKKHSIE